MLKYGKVSEVEQEVTLRLDPQEHVVRICSTWPAWSRKCEKRYGSPPKYEELDGFVVCSFWTLPIQSISLRSPRQKPSQNDTRSGRFSRLTPVETAVERPISRKRYPTFTDEIVAQTAL